MNKKENSELQAEPKAEISKFFFEISKLLQWMIKNDDEGILSVDNGSKSDEEVSKGVCARIKVYHAYSN